MARLDPDFVKAVELAAKGSQKPPMNNVYDVRTEFYDLFKSDTDTSSGAGVLKTRYDIAQPDGPSIPVYRFATAAQMTASEPQPAAIFLHPGGMVSGTVELMANVLASTVAEIGVQYWAVDYRLSPEVTAPVALEEAYATLLYLGTHAAELHIDPARLCLAGSSAGGGLAAGVALLARDRQLSPPVAKLVLIYPMLDDRTVQVHPPKGARYPGARTDDDDWPPRDFHVWTTEQNALAWAAYLGIGCPGVDGPAEAAAALAAAGDDIPTLTPYSSPARATSLAGLPSTYIDIGGLDLFAEETTEFASRLTRDNVELEYHVFHGVPHGFEFAPTSHVAKTTALLRKQAFNSF